MKQRSEIIYWIIVVVVAIGVQCWILKVEGSRAALQAYSGNVSLASSGPSRGGIGHKS